MLALANHGEIATRARRKREQRLLRNLFQAPERSKRFPVVVRKISRRALLKDSPRCLAKIVARRAHGFGHANCGGIGRRCRQTRLPPFMFGQCNSRRKLGFLNSLPDTLSEGSGRGAKILQRVLVNRKIRTRCRCASYVLLLISAKQLPIFRPFPVRSADFYLQNQYWINMASQWLNMSSAIEL